MRVIEKSKDKIVIYKSRNVGPTKGTLFYIISIYSFRYSFYNDEDNLFYKYEPYVCNYKYLIGA